jgi:ubiquinone biosynthesis protein UbiJ
VVAPSENQIDPALQVAILGAIETALVQALQYAPQTRAELNKLSGNSIHIRVVQPVLETTLLLSERPQLRSVYEDKASASIEGKLSDFLQVATAEDPAIALINGDLKIRGDTRLLQQVQTLVAELDLDWEAPISAVAGDVIGHQIGKGLRAFFRWGQHSRLALERQLSEYIAEEARLTPPPLELEDFYRDLRHLQQRLDRCEARLKRLKRERSSS